MSKQLALSSHAGRFLESIWASPHRLRLFVILLLSGVVVGLYMNSLGNSFVQWDDPGLIIQNQQIRSLEWSNIKEIFSLRRASTYQPIRVFSYAIDYRFWKLNPVGYHITNMALYLLTCIMIFFATKELVGFLREERTDECTTRIAFFTAILFSVHPVHVEAVTWLSARKEVLLGFFFFSSFYLYLRATRTRERKARIGFHGLAFVCFLLAVLSKPVAVVLPGIVLLFELYRGRIRMGQPLTKALWFSPMLVVSLVGIYVLIKAIVEADGIYPYRGGDFISNFLLAFYVFVLNLKLLATTVNYSPVYVLPLQDSIIGMRILIFVLANTGLLAFAVLIYRRSKMISFAVFWFYVTILPFSNIIPISTFLADRYVFVASFAYALVIALGLERLWSIRLKDLSKDFFPSLALAILIALSIGYGYMTVNQNRVWRDTFTLWSEALAKNPRNTVAMNGLGVVYLENRMNEEAFDILKKALEINPLDPLVHTNLGIVCERMGKHTQSEYHYLRALSLRPGHYEAQINLSNLRAKRGDFETAIHILQALLAERPNDAMLHYRLGIVYEDAGRLTRAIKHYEKSMELKPHIMNPYESLGRLYMEKLGDRDRALHFFRKGLETAPHSRRVRDIERLVKRLENS